MTYAAIMVSLALGQSNEARLQVAGELAERFKATIIGVAAGQFAPPLYFAEGPYAERLLEQGDSAVRDQLGELEQQFRASTRNRAVQVEWRVALDFPVRHALQQARCADIIVSGGEAAGGSDAFSFASPKDLVMQSGRPVLVVPNDVPWLDLRSILVAWKDTSEARRATVDALPMLRKAREVTIATVLEAEEDREAATAAVIDVVGWLERHGVIATSRVSHPSENESAADHLLSLAAELRAGLVVAGAYGHSRFRELILGGVTQDMVSQTSCCAMLSH
jgi:nucleotide-binding universal stress UspA family protein